MANRLTKIYTRTGDDGSTGMADGSRVAKDTLLIQAIGDVDELNCQLAVLACHVSGGFSGQIYALQDQLFNIGAELSTGKVMIGQSHVSALESSLDELNSRLTPLKEFILPGGGLAASHCHVSRAICRRVERTLVSVNRDESLGEHLMAYVNRLSDYLFVLARAISKEAGVDEVYWQSERLNS